MKGKKKKAKKHVFKDQTSGIMDLVQTPSAYTAWQPPEKGDGGYAASAKSDLLAAEKAFDVAGGAADSFLQLVSNRRAVPDGAFFEQAQPPVAPAALLAAQLVASRADEDGSGGSAVEIAIALLERYARAFDSDLLLRVARSRPSASRLRALWQKVRGAGTNGVMTPREKQAAKWCADFVHQSESLAKQAEERHAKAAVRLGEAAAERRILEQEVAVRQQIVRGLEREEAAVQSLKSQEDMEAAGTAALLQRLRAKAVALSPPAAAGSDDEAQMQPTVAAEALGLAEGLAQASAAELQDVVSEALARRQQALKSARAGLDHARGKLAALPKEMSEGQADVSMLSMKTGVGSGEDEDPGGLRARYSQMCRWTLEGIQARRRREEGERDALKAAVAVLSATGR